MNRDLLYGTIMAIAVAGVPLLLQVAVHSSDANLQLSDKLWFVFLIAAGAGFSAPFTLGRKGPQSTISASPKNEWEQWASSLSPATRRGLPALLCGAGVFASAYFIAVVGLHNQIGLGAGLAEIVDSGLAPWFYLLVAIRTLKARASKMTIAGLSLALAGLIVVAFSVAQTVSVQSAWTRADCLLIPIAAFGAFGTACSLFLLRVLVKGLKASIGFAVLCRYGGVAVVYLLAGISFDWAGLTRIPWLLELTAFGGGMILVNAAFVFALKIDSDTIVAASLSMVPFVTLILELIAHLLGLVQSKAPYNNIAFWGGVFLATIGIWLVQRNPVNSSQSDPVPIQEG